MSTVAGLFNYWAVIILMMAGLYILIARHNLIKKMIGLGVFQTSIFYLYITLGKVSGGTAPILSGGHGDVGGHGAEQGAEQGGDHAVADVAGQVDGHGAMVDATVEAVVYSNPLPHVLILTAIVVGVATSAVALALVIRIHEAYGTIEEDELKLMDAQEPES